MRWPKCGNLEDRVIDSRSAKAGAAIRRRRECLACFHRFTTYEEIERRDLRVIKRDGRHEPFDRQKLLSGMVKACEKRPVSYDALSVQWKILFRNWSRLSITKSRRALSAFE